MITWAVVAGFILLLPLIVAVVIGLALVIYELITMPYKYAQRLVAQYRLLCPDDAEALTGIRTRDVMRWWLVQKVWHHVPWEWVFLTATIVGGWLLIYGLTGESPVQ